MKQVIIAIAGFFLTACTTSVTAPTTNLIAKLAKIQARGSLIIATDPGYLPQSHLISGSRPFPGTKCESTQYSANQFQGFDAEVANLLGLETCFVTPPLMPFPH